MAQLAEQIGLAGVVRDGDGLGQQPRRPAQGGRAARTRGRPRQILDGPPAVAGLVRYLGKLRHRILAQQLVQGVAPLAVRAQQRLVGQACQHSQRRPPDLFGGFQIERAAEYGQFDICRLLRPGEQAP